MVPKASVLPTTPQRLTFHVIHMQMNLILYLMLISRSSIPGELRSMFNNLNLTGCLIYISDRPIENVTSYSHLRHIINCHSEDKDDALQRMCNFTVQANSFFCFYQDTGYAYKNKIVQVLSHAAWQGLAVLRASASVVLKHETSTLRQKHNFILIDLKFDVSDYVR